MNEDHDRIEELLAGYVRAGRGGGGGGGGGGGSGGEPRLARCRGGGGRSHRRPGRIVRAARGPGVPDRAAARSVAGGDGGPPAAGHQPGELGEPGADRGRARGG